MDAINNLFPNLAAALDSLLRRFLPATVADIVMMLISMVTIVLVLVVIFLGLLYAERKVIARIQDRYGPNRAGPLGILQSVADMIKMFTKEDIVPEKADRAVHLLAPLVAVVPVLLAFAVIPFGRGMIGRDLNIGILYIVAVTSSVSIAIIMAGWGSNNRYSLLGGMRAIAQLVSYEVPMALSILVAVMLAGSLSMQKIVEAQGGPGSVGLGWYVFLFPVGPVAFLTYFISAVAETNRSPFDLPEAESEIVAGYHTEYSGLKWGLFMMAEYLSMVAQACVVTVLFLGGWQGPILPSYVWFFLKLSAIIFVFMWFRGTLPRFRVDQLMGFAWKVLVPIALLNIFVTGGIISLAQAITK